MAMMVYEVNLKLRFLPADGQIAHCHAVRKRKHNNVRLKSVQCSADAVNATQKTRKTKPYKIKQK